MIHHKKLILTTCLCLILLLHTQIGTSAYLISQHSSVLSSDSSHREYSILKTTLSLGSLERWFTSQPAIEFASAIDTSMTIKFVDGTYVVFLDYHPQISTNTNRCTTHRSPLTEIRTSEDNMTALLLNPSAYLYGDRHCTQIGNTLHAAGYATSYLSDNQVTLSVIKNNLTAAILYLNTHAGYWDIDGDHTPDAVVIATGEPWTATTPDDYAFEYTNHMIIKGLVGDDAFIAFTPALIEYYYEEDDCANALIYMATCHAAYDSSMADAFLSAGASTYLSWTRGTISWTNSLTSQLMFLLLSRGLSIQQICSIIGPGGLLNFLLLSRLTYYGDGTYTLPTA